MPYGRCVIQPVMDAMRERRSTSGGITILRPASAVAPTGTWSVFARTGDFVFLAGMRGIDPQTNTLAESEAPRVRQAFRNMQAVAASEGASLRDAVRLTVY